MAAKEGTITANVTIMFGKGADALFAMDHLEECGICQQNFGAEIAEAIEFPDATVAKFEAGHTVDVSVTFRLESGDDDDSHISFDNDDAIYSIDAKG